MDTNKMRDDLPSLVKRSIEAHPAYGQFAAWCKSELIHPYPIYFLIWQASREAVVVELPPVRPEPVSTGDALKADGEAATWNMWVGEKLAKEECRAAIDAQGLKVAP